MQTKFDLYEVVKDDKAIFLISCLMGILSILPIINSIYYFGMVQSDAFAATGTTLMALFTFLFATKEAREAYYKRLADRPILEISDKKVKGNEITFKVKNVGNSPATELKLIIGVIIPQRMRVKYEGTNITKFRESGWEEIFEDQKIFNQTVDNITFVNETSKDDPMIYTLRDILKPGEETELSDVAKINFKERTKRECTELSKLQAILRKIRKRYAKIYFLLSYYYLDDLKYKEFGRLIFDRDNHKNLEDAWKAGF